MVLDQLESRGIDVSADRLEDTRGMVANPFEPGGPMDLEVLKKYDISVTNYVPYQDRIEKDRPWYPSLIAARREILKRDSIRVPITREQPKIDEEKEEGHIYLNVERRHSESSLAGVSSAANTSQFSDILGSIHGGTTWNMDESVSP